MNGRWCARTLDLLVTSRCHHCRGVVGGGPWSPFLCSTCGRALVLDGRPRSIDARLDATALLAYEGPARSLVRALKFEGNTVLGRRLGEAMRPLVEAVEPGAVGLVPVPLHWSRRWRRGHNQAETLARGLAGARPGFRLRRQLRRRGAATAQVGLGRRARRRNVAGAFVSRGRSPAASPVVVVDDVITTGATVRVAAGVLCASGFRVVGVVALARAVVPPGD